MSPEPNYFHKEKNVMSVEINSNNNENTIGLVAISSNQNFVSHPAPPHHYVPATMQHSLGIGSSWFRRTLTGILSGLTHGFTSGGISSSIKGALYGSAEPTIGHTAVMARVNGAVIFVRGFLPTLIQSPLLFFGRDTTGNWVDDFHILNDPTCISFEIPEQNIGDAANLPLWFLQHQHNFNIYSLRRGDAFNTTNCVLAAATMLVNYLLDQGNYDAYVTQLLNIDSSSQGRLMGQILGGFQ